MRRRSSASSPSKAAFSFAHATSPNLSASDFPDSVRKTQCARRSSSRADRMTKPSAQSLSISRPADTSLTSSMFAMIRWLAPGLRAIAAMAVHCDLVTPRRATLQSKCARNCREIRASFSDALRLSSASWFNRFPCSGQTACQSSLVDASQSMNDLARPEIVIFRLIQSQQVTIDIFVLRSQHGGSALYPRLIWRHSPPGADNRSHIA